MRMVATPPRRVLPAILKNHARIVTAPSRHRIKRQRHDGRAQTAATAASSARALSQFERFGR
jgi:hypothetical protein